jgi:hypothetical protein
MHGVPFDLLTEGMQDVVQLREVGIEIERERWIRCLVS